MSALRVLKSLNSIQTLALTWKREGLLVGFVPTMGSLHPGHISLVEQARTAVGPTGKVVLSIYVNPTQFGANEDLAHYPRGFREDLKLCRSAGVDVVFAPCDRDMFLVGGKADYSTWVEEQQISMGMEGAARPTHFRGVTTVVAKLFNLVLPDVAVFGAKDFQQAAVIGRMVDNLHFPIRIILSPTVRESDGLALSTRNRYLDPAHRAQAVVLSRLISKAREVVGKSRGGILANELRTVLNRVLEGFPLARLDYIEFFCPSTLQPLGRVKRGSQMAVAAFLGSTRLIDNGPL